MATHTVEVTIDCEPEAVWAVVGDYGGLDAWMPNVESCELDGDDRVVVVMGLPIRERLVRRDAAARTITYSIVESPLPLDAHEAEIVVHSSGAGSRVTWRVETTPDEHAAMMGGIYQQSLDALRAHCEGPAPA
jgi:mxaD protein